MAYTKIKPVKHHLQRCLDYTSNPKKTEKFSADDLNRLLSYTQNQNKTEHQLYVTGFRCNPATAYRRMYRTKKRWNQPMDEGDILAYHIIQSFSPGEATPDQVHKIGCEFARRFLADRFECTVSTHLDKGHLHNHIVVNSVSYADGKMFRNNFDTYYHGIRQVSDELCRENRLSVIETDGKGKSYDEWLSGQTGKPTIRGMVRKDVEQAIAAADSFNGFIIDDFGWPRNPDGYNALVKRVAKKAGLKDIHPHMFRHTFVSLLMSNPDIGVATVAAEAGHAQPSTTLMIYTQQYKKRRESIRNQLSRELYEK